MSNFDLWGLRLLALGLAIGLWWVVSVEKREPASEKVVEATITYNAPAGFIIIDPIDTVRVRLRGTTSQILRVNPMLIDAIVQVPEATVGNQQVNLGPANIVGPRDVEVVSIDPNVLTIKLDQEVTGMLPVEATLVGEPAAGAIVRDPVIVRPGQVLVRGPQATLRQTTALRTSPVDLTGHAIDFEEQAAVVSPEPLITVVQPAVVTIMVPMEIPVAGSDAGPPFQGQSRD